jgi:hypothetical protein
MSDTPRSDSKREPAPVAKPEMPPQADKHGEVGGPKGLEPTRYGDWERDGRCVDF